jgi:hypothetical protein
MVEIAVNVRTFPVIVALPSAWRVTWAVFCPVDTTDAMAGSEDTHCTTSVAPAGVNVAVRVAVVPTLPDEVAGATLIAVAGTVTARVTVGETSAAVISS